MLSKKIKRAIDAVIDRLNYEWDEFIGEINLYHLIIFLGLLALAFWTTQFTSGFGLNAFTELLGVALTIFIINRVLENRKQKDKLPARVLVYTEVVAMTNRIIRIWSNVEISTASARSSEIQDLLNQANIAKLAQRLDLMGKSPHTAKNWLEFFEREITIVQNHHMKLLSQYANYLSPHQISLIHGIAEESVYSLAGFNGMVETYNNNVKKYNSDMSIFPSYLSSILPAPNFTYSNILELHKICLEENNYLKQQGITWLEPPTISSGTVGDNIGSSLLSPERKTAQAKVPELIPWWKDVYGWQSTHPGNWWLRENSEFNHPVVVRAN